LSNVDEWISAEFQRLAELINEYDHNLFLEMIPVAEQQHLIDKSKVFRVVDDAIKKVVFHFSSLSNPTDILAQIYSMDSAHGDVVSRMDAHNVAVERMKLRNKEDKRAAVVDFTEFVFRNQKNTWKHAGVKRDSEFRDLGSTSKTFT
jgi:hypothetical protein